MAYLVRNYIRNSDDKVPTMLPVTVEAQVQICRLEHLHPRAGVVIRRLGPFAYRAIVNRIMVEVGQTPGRLFANRPLAQDERRHRVDHAISIGGKLADFFCQRRAAIEIDDHAHIIAGKTQYGDIAAVAIAKTSPNNIVLPVPFRELRNAATSFRQVGLEAGSEATNLVGVKQA